MQSDPVISTHIIVLVDGKPLSLNKESNTGRDYCGKYCFNLVRAKKAYHDEVEFRLADEAAVRRFLRAGSTAWYNSSADCPDWGDIAADEMSFLKVTTTTTSEPIEIVMPARTTIKEVVGRNFDTRDVLPIYRTKYDLPAEPARLIAVQIWANNTGKFEVSSDQARDRLTGFEIPHGIGEWTLAKVVQTDPDFYYIFLQELEA